MLVVLIVIQCSAKSDILFLLNKDLKNELFTKHPQICQFIGQLVLIFVVCYSIVYALISHGYRLKWELNVH